MSNSSIKEYLTIDVGGQLFGISVENIRDVLSEQKIISIPLAPLEVAGSLNLRGRIVTAIDLKSILNINSKEENQQNNKMSVVVEYQEELYSLIANNVGEVLSLENYQINTSQENLSSRWREYALGIYALDDKLVVILNIQKIFNKYDDVQENL
jgi:purine-binding chemotaxis protein CheW